MVETQSKPITQEKLPKEATLHDLRILPHDHAITSLTRILDRRGGEGWIYGYRADSTDPNGNANTTHFREKHIISMAGDLEFKAQQHYRKMREVESQGIPTLKGYGVRGATVYEEFIPEDGTHIALNKIQTRNIDEQGLTYLNQLIDIAVKLDAAGYPAHRFYREFIFDPRREMFLLVDAGQDLGMPTNKPSDRCRKTLINDFRHQAAYIESYCSSSIQPQEKAIFVWK
jgi:hypothetical protein